VTLVGDMTDYTPMGHGACMYVWGGVVTRVRHDPCIRVTGRVPFSRGYSGAAGP